MGSVALVLVNGVPRQQAITTSLPLIYDESVTIVATGGGGSGSNSLNGPIAANTPITLPASGNYTLNTNSVPNLQVYLNGDRTESTLDWNASGAGPTYTAITFTFELMVGDRVDLVVERQS
jgi:hypothetical protein